MDEISSCSSCDVDVFIDDCIDHDAGYFCYKCAGFDGGESDEELDIKLN